MQKYHPLEEPQCGLSMDVSYDAVKPEPIRQLADCNAYAGVLHIIITTGNLLTCIWLNVKICNLITSIQFLI